ncbi:MAG: hypothetical protein JW993_10825 [Sedimentisphaerales bacterium]|nr:hypothetical protein [Sedimentisphaerales bacterium]
MRGQIDVKSAALGALLAVLVMLVAGSDGNGREAPQMGRFQIACTNTECFEVDTATGQVWRSSSGSFSHPKLQGPAAANATIQSSDFLGRWLWEDPKASDRSLRLEPGGRVSYTEEGRGYEGLWYVEGTRMIVAIDNETFAGEMQPDGRLILSAPGRDDKQVSLKKAP